jgi:hypothetical protein
LTERFAHPLTSERRLRVPVHLARELAAVLVAEVERDILDVPSGPGEESGMTCTFRLVTVDGAPADPPSFKARLRDAVGAGGHDPAQLGRWAAVGEGDRQARHL